MLPTTGYFKCICCPFYEACICERPFCHFKHTKRDTSNEKNLISELVSDAVRKVFNNNIISPTEAFGNTTQVIHNAPGNIVTYNPTPISELNKYKTNSSTTNNSEKGNYYIPSQYKPEHPCSTITSSYSSNIDASKNTLVGYSSNLNIPTSPNCLSSAIITLEDSPTTNSTSECSATVSHTTPESHIHQYVPFDLKESSQSNISQPSSSSSEKIPDGRHSRSSDSRQSKRSNEKYEDKRKEKKCDEKLKQNKKVVERHRNRDKHRKPVQSSSDKSKKSSGSSSKGSESTKKTELKELSDDDRSSSPTPDILFDSNDADVSDTSEDEVEQCKRIFEEYQPPVKNVPVKQHRKPEPAENETSTVASSSKKRVAHEKSSSVFRKQTAKPVAAKTAALVMAERYKKVLPNLEEENNAVLNLESAVFKRPLDLITDSTIHNPTKTRRIAPVSNVSLLLNAKRKIELAKTEAAAKTPVQTLAKGSKRVAHIPEVLIADIPIVLQSERSKLPVNIRNKYLYLMVKECVKLYSTRKAAYERALNEENNCYSKCSTVSTYRNSVMLSINRLRKEAETGLTLPSSSRADDSEFSGKRFYEHISKWILNEEELVDNGYPRPGAPKKGYAVFKANKIIEKVPEGCQLCARCRKEYKVDEEGRQIYPKDCIYHPGKLFVSRGENQYMCCKEPSSSSGCCTCPNHVFEIRDPANLTGFISTFVPEKPDDPRNFAVYALDCEMVYTTRGIELARVTVIDNGSDVVFESMIKPMGHILDCNTRFSGLTTEMLEDVTTTLTDVQATLLLMFNSKTILIGHSLESDFKALRLIHSTVIDTSVLFPHKLGPPKKRSLKSLASDFLKKIIQNDEAGHDSAEDAVTCMELIIWKLKEEMKLH